MTQIELKMPTLTDSEMDWICYINVIKIAAQKVQGYRAPGSGTRLEAGWEVHRLAMEVLMSEAWRRHPRLKPMVMDNVKITIGLMEKMMSGVNIGRKERADWKKEQRRSVEAKDRAEGRLNYRRRVRQEAEEDTNKKRKTENMEVVFKRQKTGDGEQETYLEAGNDSLDWETVDPDLPGIETAKVTDSGRVENQGDVRELFYETEDEEESMNEEERANEVRETREQLNWEGEEEEEPENEEEDDEKPRVEGLYGVDKVDEGVYIFHHDYKTEERLYNRALLFGRVENMLNRDGTKLEDPDNIPPIVRVEFEKQKDKRDTGERRQMWKIKNNEFNHFENITLKEGRLRWDTCDEDNLFDMIKNDEEITVRMKDVIEETKYYSKKIRTYYKGKKMSSCEAGKICLAKVRRVKVMNMPGRAESSESVSHRECIQLRDIDTIQVK